AAAALVFVASAIIHTLLPYHRRDFKGVADEDAVMDALRSFDIPAGDYVIPFAGGDMELMKSDEFRAKAARGPVAFMTVLPKGDPFAMRAQLTQWFVYCIVVSVFAAYVAGRAVGPGAEYLAVHRFAGVTAFAGYGLAHFQRSIWFNQSWCTTLKSVFDALIYGLLTGGVFGWLWPAG
ncbi:MAG: hypothetical protein RQ745_12575, partial [Longimicrobiales bacterium]|nr:hypothetical protein [Longimicrobiales bacterium]